jgi:hypothetical protein
VRYLTLSADDGDPAVRDERLGRIRIEDEGLLQDLVDDLLAWNARDQPIVAADMRERGSGEIAPLIDELDRLGMALADR